MSRLTDSFALPLIFHDTSRQVVERLLAWFEREGRRFPWRDVERATLAGRSGPIHDPYVVLVSEVMLQQTQTSRVAEKLPQFLERFPDVGALARAGRSDVIRAWQGMGYNRRALALQRTAVEVVERYGGEFPRTLAELTALPGVGPYTASAILCFAFGDDVPVVDVNIARVYSRLFHKCHTAQGRASEGTVEIVAAAIVPAGDAYRWHQALMDLGATICTARRPACARCPLESLCLSAHPLPVELYDDTANRREPEIRGVPRRIWRGRMLELLRSSHEPARVGDLIDLLLPHELFGGTLLAERCALLMVARVLMAEGFIERAGVVREGELEEGERVRLAR
jgi:A/G-specific adenine glycosylase